MSEVDPVVVGFAPPATMRRVTVAFRIILAVPAMVFAGALFFFGMFALIAGWFSALVMGRLPNPIFRYLHALTGVGLRLGAYLYFLTDVYPPFQLRADDYPVIAQTRPTRLNRLAVLFRIVLFIPAQILNSMIGTGLLLASFFLWLVALITGRLPRVAYEAVAAAVRFQTRCGAYILLVTPAYPSALFGDRPAGAPDPKVWQPLAAGSPLPPPGNTAAPPSPPPPPPPGAWSSAGPRATRLVLSRGAKRLLAVFLVLGALSNALNLATPRSTNNNTVTADARR